MKPSESSEAVTESESRGNAPWYSRLTILLYMPALGGSIIIFLLYWSLVYPTFPEDRKRNVLPIDVFQHGINVLIMIADLVINAQPLPLITALRFVLYGIVYVIWTAIWHGAGLYRIASACECGGESRPGCVEDGDQDRCYFIYEALNWHRPAAATIVAVLCVFVLVPIIAAFVWGLDRAIGALTGAHKGEPKAATGCEALKAELSLRQLSTDLHEGWVASFATSPLLGSGRLYLAARGSLMLLMLAIDIWFSALPVLLTPGVYLLIWLTNWTLYLQFIYLAFAALATFYAQRACRAEAPVAPPPLQAAEDAPGV
jgi:hypothetical protein